MRPEILLSKMPAATRAADNPVDGCLGSALGAAGPLGLSAVVNEAQFLLCRSSGILKSCEFLKPSDAVLPGYVSRERNYNPEIRLMAG